MEVDNGKGCKAEAVSAVIPPSIFRAKIEHPTYEIWKVLSESKKEDWENIKKRGSRKTVW